MRRILLVSALVLLSVGCGDDSAKRGGAAGGLDDGLLSMLRAVPDSEGTRGEPIYYGNYRRLRNGDEASTFEDDVTMLIERAPHALRMPDAVSAGILLPEFVEFTGFDTRAIDAYLDFGARPDGVSVMVGRIEASALGTGLAASPGGEELRKETTDGVAYFSLGAEDEIGGEISAIRELGQAVRIAVDGSAAYWTRKRSALDVCIAAVLDNAASLADDPAYSAVASMLDNGEVVSALIVTPHDPRDWTLAGVGESFQGETSTLTIALQYPDAARASAAVLALGDLIENGQSDVSGVRWSDFLTATDIHSEGPLLVATITSSDPGVASGIVFQQENLLDV